MQIDPSIRYFRTKRKIYGKRQKFCIINDVTMYLSNEHILY